MARWCCVMQWVRSWGFAEPAADCWVVDCGRGLGSVEWGLWVEKNHVPGCDVCGEIDGVWEEDHRVFGKIIMVFVKRVIGCMWRG